MREDNNFFFSIKLKLLLTLAVLALVLASLWIFYPGLKQFGKSSDHKIYLSFGMHVNLFHSDKDDGLDEDGVGRDWQNLKQSLLTLDKLKKEKIDISMAWDIEEHHSLRRGLLRFAPDIVSRIEQRVLSSADELHATSFKGAILSLMNPSELRDTFALSKQNQRQIALTDFFSKMAPVLRPEQLIWPMGGQGLLQAQGFEALVLDANRFLKKKSVDHSEPNPDLFLYNPFHYQNDQQAKSIVVIPAFGLVAIQKMGGLKNWVQSLRADQLDNKIDSDLFIYINEDSKSPFWMGTKNVASFYEEVQSVANFKYIKFDGPYRYLKQMNASSFRKFDSKQLTLENSEISHLFEKSQMLNVWKNIQRDRYLEGFIPALFKKFKRRVPNTILKTLQDSYGLRMELFSNGYVGLNGDVFLAPSREAQLGDVLKKIKSLHDFVLGESHRELDRYLRPSTSASFAKIVLVPSANTTSRRLILEFDKDHELYKKYGGQIRLKNRRSKTVEAVLWFKEAYEQRVRVHYLLDDKFMLEPEIYDVEAQDALTTDARANNWELVDDGNQLVLNHAKTKCLSSGSLLPRIEYNGRFVIPEYKIERMENEFNIEGKLNISSNLRSGNFKYRIVPSPRPGLALFIGHLQLPLTVRNVLINVDQARLRRMIDPLWQSLTPVPLLFDSKKFWAGALSQYGNEVLMTGELKAIDGTKSREKISSASGFNGERLEFEYLFNCGDVLPTSSTSEYAFYESPVEFFVRGDSQISNPQLEFSQMDGPFESEIFGLNVLVKSDQLYIGWHKNLKHQYLVEVEIKNEQNNSVLSKITSSNYLKMSLASESEFLFPGHNYSLRARVVKSDGFSGQWSQNLAFRFDGGDQKY